MRRILLWVEKYKHYLLLIWILLVLIATLIPGNKLPKNPNWATLLQPDKLVHLVIFGVLNFLLLSNLKIRNRKKVILCFVIGIVLAGGTEILQGILPIKRSMNIYDMIANIIGLFLGFLLWRLSERKLVQKKPE